MKHSKQPKYKTREQAIQAYWRVHKQWNGQSTTQYTTSYCSSILREIINNWKLSSTLRQQARNLQDEIIVRPASKKLLLDNDISVISLGVHPIR
jgi:hypothetical protein